MGQANFWGDLIKSLREEQNVSQRKLAHLAKVNRSTLRHIEDGDTSADIDVLERCLNALGHEIDVFTSETPRTKQEMSPKDRILSLALMR